MTFAELVAEVYSLTRRPDRVAETESAVKSATLTAHQADYFAKDIQQVGINFGSAAYLWDFDYASQIPLYRAFKYLRKYDAVNSEPGDFIQMLSPEQLFDGYGRQKPDVCYLAGSNIHISSSTQEQYYLLGVYVHPTIATASYNSWVAREYPYAIIYNAAATVFKAIGKDEEAAAFRQLVGEQFRLLINSNVVAEGF